MAKWLIESKRDFYLNQEQPRHYLQNVGVGDLDKYKGLLGRYWCKTQYQ